MSYGLSIKLFPEPIRSLDFSVLSGSYAGVGTSFDHPIRIIFIQNLTDQTLMFSFNGIDDHFPLPEMGFLLLDVTANKAVSQGYYIQEGQRIYVREIGAAASAGAVYVTVFYGLGVS